MDRRLFIKSTVFGVFTASNLISCKVSNKTHIISLSFDDGFKKSFYKTADIYERYGLHACFNVITSGHFPDFKLVGDYIKPKQLGNFDDWNALKHRGHEIMPHGWQHLKLTVQPLEKAKELIDKSIEYFEQHLDGFIAKEAVFNFPYNSSNTELEDYALSKVRAVRTNGETPINKIPYTNMPIRIGCKSQGPENIDTWIEKQIKDFLSYPGGWLVLNTHGLDDEGWGPLSSNQLNILLSELVKIDTLDVLPVGEVIKKYAS